MLKGNSKWIALAVVVVLLIAVVAFVALRPPAVEPEEPVAEEPVVEEPVVEEPVVEEPVVEEPEPEVVDFGGRTIVVSSWFDLTPREGTPRGDQVIARIAELEEKFNFNLKFTVVPFGEYLELMAASVLAGDPLADKCVLHAMHVFRAARQGLIQPLQDLYDLTDPWWHRLSIEYFTYEDNTYAVVSGRRTEVLGIMFWNRTLFEREGLPNIHELVKNREWTWDKMLEIAKQATRDLDGDGDIDQWGLGNSDGMLLDALIASNDAEIVEIIDGRPTYVVGGRNAMEALQMFYDLHHTHKVVDTAPPGEPPPNSVERFQGGHTAMLAFHFWLTHGMSATMVEDYSVSVFPMGPKATRFVSSGDGPRGIAMPVGVKNPEQVALFWRSYIAPFPEDIEDPEAWVPRVAGWVRDEESIDTLRTIWGEGLQVHMRHAKFWGSGLDGWGEVVTGLARGELTPAVAIAERLAPLQTALDDGIAAIEAAR